MILISIFFFQINEFLLISLHDFVLLQLTIKAQDLGSPSLSSEKTITIALKNIDDNAPIFNTVSANQSTGNPREVIC